MFEDLHVRYFISLGLTIIGIILTWLGTATYQTLMWIGIGILVVGTIVSWTIRCPHCGHGLMRRRQFLLPNYCPNCGEKL